MRALVIVLLLSTLVIAQPSPVDLLGTRSGAFSARSLGLGHAFLTRESGPAALMGNPATLVEQQGSWRFDLSGDLSRVKETRKYPFYDAFNGVLGYNNYALNDELYSKINGGVAWRVPLVGIESLVVSAGSFSAYDFDYTYNEKVRDRYASGGIQDRRLGENQIHIGGDLRTLSVGAAAKAYGPLAMGFSFNPLMGDWTYTKGVYYVSSDSNIVDRIEYSPNGTPAEIAFGATYQFSERVTVGARALLPAGDYSFSWNHTTQHGDTVHTSNGSTSVTYPTHVAAGVEFRPQAESRPRLLLEGEWHSYSDVIETYDDTYEVRAGVEQQVVPGAPVRLGFVYATSPSDKDHATTLFTAGIGFQIKKLAGDFGLELGKTNYMADDLFPQHLYGGTDRTDRDRVETALFRGLITLKYEL